MRPSATRSWRFCSVTVEGKKSPVMKPAGAPARALDGFFPLAALLLFVIAASAVEAEKNGFRRSRLEAGDRRSGENGGGALFRPRTAAFYNPPSESLTRGPAKSQGIPLTERERYVAKKAARRSRSRAPTYPALRVITALRVFPISFESRDIRTC
jgi:hypothetical protein